MKKISRRRLRSMILNEMGSMGDLSSLGKKDLGYKEVVSIPGESDLPGMVGFRSAIANLPEKVEELCDFLNEKIKDLPSSNEPLDERRGRELQYMLEEIEKFMKKVK